MSWAMHELAEAGHRILNPFTPAKLAVVGEVARVGSGTRILDLACGKGELLSTWAADLGSTGHGWTSARSSWPPPRPGRPSWA